MWIFSSKSGVYNFNITINLVYPLSNLLFIMLKYCHIFDNFPSPIYLIALVLNYLNFTLLASDENKEKQ